MDSHIRQSLDNYITGGRYRAWDEEIECRACGHKWLEPMFEEYGRSYYKDDDWPVCPECGHLVEEDEDR